MENLTDERKWVCQSCGTTVWTYLNPSPSVIEHSEWDHQMKMMEVNPK